MGWCVAGRFVGVLLGALAVYALMFSLSPSSHASASLLSGTISCGYLIGLLWTLSSTCPSCFCTVISLQPFLCPDLAPTVPVRYSFLDARGVGALEGLRLSKVYQQVNYLNK